MAMPEALVELESVPQEAPEQPTPVRAQVTPLFCGSLVTVALKDFVPFGACTLAAVGATTTAMAGGAVTVIAAEEDFVESATDVAVSVTLAGVGTLAGAV